MHRKGWILAAVLFLACVSVAMAQVGGLKANLIGDNQHGGISTTSKCAGCHTPHGGVNGNTLLWTQSTAATNYGRYDSASMINKTTAITGAANGGLTQGEPKNNTLLCLSCHDGALALTNNIVLTTGNWGTQGLTLDDTLLDL